MLRLRFKRFCPPVYLYYDLRNLFSGNFRLFGCVFTSKLKSLTESYQVGLVEPVLKHRCTKGYWLFVFVDSFSRLFSTFTWTYYNRFFLCQKRLVSIGVFVMSLIIIPFLANVSVLYPLKTPENFCFSGVFREYKIETMAKNGLFFPHSERFLVKLICHFSTIN